MGNEYIKANPCHPGEHLRECVRMEGLTAKEVAESIGVSRILLNRILAGESSITAKTALALERMGWGKAEFWLNSQVRHDLMQARGGGRERKKAPSRAFSDSRRRERLSRSPKPPSVGP